MITHASQTKWRLEADEKFRKKKQKKQKRIDSFVMVNKSKSDSEPIAKGIVNDIINLMFFSVDMCGSILYELFDGVCFVSKTKVLAHLLTQLVKYYIYSVKNSYCWNNTRD